MKKKISWETYSFTKSDDFDSEPVIANTVFGQYRMDDTLNPMNHFDFWVCNTNFDITKEIFDRIDTIIGVEVMMVLSRYKLIIGVGELFDASDVKVNIERELCGQHKIPQLIEEINNIDVENEVKDCYEDIRDFDYWAIYVFPNGVVKHICSPEKSAAFNQQFDLFQFASNKCGILLTYEDDT